MEPKPNLNADDTLTYCFITEDGTFELTYRGYLLQPELAEKIRNKSTRIHLNLGRTIVSYDRKWLYEDAHRRQRQDVEELQADLVENPLKYYLPCCAKSGLESFGHAYINDVSNEVCMLYGPNRVGKTTLMWIKMLTTRGVAKCDPTWPIFTDHGIRYVEYTGPKMIGISTFQQKNITRTLWPQMIRAWTPNAELGPYGRGRRKSPPLREDPHIPLVAGGSVVYLMSYAMKSGVYESQALSHFAWDEPSPEWAFNAVETRMSSTRYWHLDGDDRIMDGGTHDFAMTPMVILDAGYPTGAGTWSDDMFNGRTHRELRVSAMTGTLDEVPDWILSEEVKLQKYEQYILEPTRRVEAGDLQAQLALEQGRARYYGIPEKRGGLVYPEWSRETHLVEPFDVPQDWTFYRSVDHGRRHPAAVIIAAVDPNDNLFIVRTVKRVNANVDELALAIIEATGNTIERVERGKRERYKEVQSRRHVRWTKMDPRACSKSSDETGEILSEIYAKYGLRVEQGAGRENRFQFPMVAQLLKVDPDREHPTTKKKGSPRLFVFDTQENRDNFVEEIERYLCKVGESGITDEPLKRGGDDMMDALKYLVTGKPKYVPGYGTRLEAPNRRIREKEFNSTILAGRSRNPISGY